ncbi:PEP/pyruvate-binding domain-containing protein [Carboxylicivirga linearis]|uniref:Pyruvate, phosphate dikinase n=1 Tax=Carboxylicivirga linearis TaxID=1628157 RepID=A0ABS5JS01_9BACT|nr:PEP/pyruvate-binding domain-containing protein [Carboxylicivirga linearis]MBS2097181.1 pyruvate, phosphate dikinase [Carboxylicivirga linearis]
MEPTQELELSQIYNRRVTDKDIFQELMTFKVREILLVANHYDAYSIVREGRFFDKIAGEYLQLNLFTAPRITSVNSADEALLLLKERSFEMVIVMAGLDKKQPLKISHQIKEAEPEVPILLLVNNNADLKFFDEASGNIDNIERVFVWNGDSRVFLAMIKYVEDKKNVAKDVHVGDVRIILLVEDSQKYYTRYLPLLYSIIMRQTQAILEEESLGQIHRMLKMRVRPKILLVSNYEDAVEVVDKYTDNLICLISDVKYKRNGLDDENAGVELIKNVKSKIVIPSLLQSSDPENAEKAKLVNAEFIDKNSDSLSLDIYNFIHQRLGFGNFVFTNSRGAKVAEAHNLREFVQCLADVPPESLLYHARRNGLSTWLMARGEITIAKRLRPYRIEDFESFTKLRQVILDVFEDVRLERLRGRVVSFEKSLVKSSRYVIRIGEGSFGGKGRGMAFLSNFIENIDFDEIVQDINIRIPATAIIGADEFTHFIEKNNLYTLAFVEQKYEEIKKLFLKAELSDEVNEKLYQYLEQVTCPLAIRSSGLFEDSLLQPFAGVYATYMVPNNNSDINIRFKQLCTAIKLVYASMFSDSAKAYFDAVNYKIEEEKMAVIIQQVVGQRVGDRYYPHISGVAQSYNYYPFSYMKPEDGFAVLGVGLGKYVVGGEKAYRFCPKHPKLELNSIQDQIKDSQSYFYALNLDDEELDMESGGEDASILKLSIKEVEEDGNLRHCASVYDMNYDRMVNDFSKRGPRVLNFANILKYDYIPLAPTLDMLLRFFKQAMGAPVEIEFAVDMDAGRRNLPTLYLLQIKPLIRIENHVEINFDEVPQERLLLQSNKGMGNGHINYITDVVYMNIDVFDRTQTEEMGKEVAELNKYFEKEGKEYVLIGPGRWGTRDRFTGIPVYWSQISHARVIVEMGLPNFPLDASLGSHFFHNVTSMNVGYFSIHQNGLDKMVNFDVLKKQDLISETKYFKHVRFAEPLEILMDGKKQKAAIIHK